ncbi:hypothetical protein WG902_07220 [Ramlibacter sp. PS3R-8]|uniref:hypothetical protein n=1 Tax=Ramlibacter sp. PS3R-8 TaxID=3133437 RepID=UPI0030B09FED
MWKSLAAVLLPAAVFASGLAKADRPDEFTQGMETMWEAMWHQSGMPTRLVRWEQDIKVRITGVNLVTHKQHTLDALRTVAAEAGVQVIDVSDAADAQEQANLSIDITPNSDLSENQPCETRLDYQTEDRIEAVSMQMRDSDAARCIYHEAMHVMGVRGHPEGNTVLSYFTGHVEGLQPLDKAMLHAWYSPQVRGGMTPFEVMPALADELVRILPDREQALQSRDRFFTRTIQQMHAFAEGEGDVPQIVKRCGKATAEGIRLGRREMSYFLSVAYAQGATVAKDAAQAKHWMQRAANLGSGTAAATTAEPAASRG